MEYVAVLGGAAVVELLAALYVINLSKHTLQGVIAATVLSAFNAALAYGLAKQVLIELDFIPAFLCAVAGEAAGTLTAGLYDLWRTKRNSESSSGS